jgi:hypothetical protein
MKKLILIAAILMLAAGISFGQHKIGINMIHIGIHQTI